MDRRACQVFCVSGHVLGLEVGLDTVGVGECELREGLLPVRGDLALDEASFGVALRAAGPAALLEAVSCALVLDVADREP